MPRRELRKMLATKYDFVCGVGSDCGCAGHLVRNHLRQASYPLDWIGVWELGPEGTARLIADEFAGFLRLENLRKCPYQPTDDYRDRDHEFYLDVAQRVVFGHDFPVGRPPAEAYPAVKAKYDRRVRRFYETVRRSRAVLFVRWSWRENPTEASVVRMAEILRGKFPGRRIDVLMMRNADRPELAARTLGDGVFLVDGPFHPDGGHPAFGDKAANDAVFSLIRLRGKGRADLRRHLARLWVRLRSAFIFDRERRHAFRERVAGPERVAF